MEFVHIPPFRFSAKNTTHGVQLEAMIGGDPVLVQGMDVDLAAHDFAVAVHEAIKGKNWDTEDKIEAYEELRDFVEDEVLGPKSAKIGIDGYTISS